MNNKKEVLEKILQDPIYLKDICGFKDLSWFHNDWIKWLFGDEDPSNNKLLSAHRNSYKTTAIIIGFIWILLRDADETTLLVRKTLGLSILVLRAISKQLKNPYIQELFELRYGKKFSFTRDNDKGITLCYKKSSSLEPNIMSLGIGDSATGLHFSRIHNDDVVTLADRRSYAERQKTFSFCHEEENLIKTGGKITFTGTPWHTDDFYSTLKNRREYPVGKVKVVGFGEDRLKKIKESIPPDLYALNYDLKFMNTGNCRFSDLRYGEFPSEGNCYAHIDAGYSGKDNTALTILNVVSKEEIYVLGFKFSGNVIDNLSKIYKKLIEYSIISLFMESNADKGLLAERIKHDFKSNQPFKIILYHEKTKKEIKINNYLSVYMKYIYFIYTDK